MTMSTNYVPQFVKPVVDGSPITTASITELNAGYMASDGSTQFRTEPVTVAVNYVQVQGAVTGSGPSFSVQGSDTNIDMNFAAKGSGGVYFGNGYGFAAAFLDKGNTQSSVNYVGFKGGQTTVSPSVTATGSDTNIDLILAAKGTGVVNCSSPVKVPVYTFATLPVAAVAIRGARAMITDCNTTTFNATAAAGGANIVPVFCDGTNWKVG